MNNKINLSGQVDNYYTAMQQESWSKREIKEHKYNCFLNQSLYSGNINDNTCAFFEINEQTLKKCDVKTIFIGKKLNVLKIKKSLISIGKKPSRILVIEDFDNIKFSNENEKSYCEILSNVMENIELKSDIKLQDLFYNDLKFNSFFVFYKYIIDMFNKEKVIKEIEDKYLKSFVQDAKSINIDISSILSNDISSIQGKSKLFINDLNLIVKQVFIFLSCFSDDGIVLNNYDHFIISVKNKDVNKLISSYIKNFYLYEKIKLDVIEQIKHEKKHILFCLEFNDYFIENFEPSYSPLIPLFQFNYFLNDFLFFENEKYKEYLPYLIQESRLFIGKNKSKIMDTVQSQLNPHIYILSNY